MKTKLNIIPSTRIIRSWRQDTRIKIDAVIKELVDNSFDWKATKVEINGSTTGITVSDNGRGISNIEQALRFGESESEHKRLGRFGIALKKGPARLARFLNIRTQNKRESINLEVDWLALERSSQWSLDSDIKPASSKLTFTEVEMLGIYNYRISGWKDLPAKLSATFAPALRDGKQILFDGVPLTAPPEPLLEEKIEASGYAGGRSFTVRAGLRPENGDGGSLGVSVEYLHRVVTKEWTPKFLLRCSLRRFVASVTLIDGDTEESHWSLNNFKDDIDEEQQAELEAALELILKPLIDRIKDETHNLRIKTLEQRLVNVIFGQGKDTYLRKDKDGGIERPVAPTKKGRRSKRRRKLFAEKVGEYVETGGEEAVTYGERTFAFDFQEWSHRRELIYIMAPAGGSLKLVVNTAHKYGAELEAQFNRDQCDAVIATAVWAIGGYMTSKDDYQKAYPYLLNGVDNVFDATNINVSHWLELGAAV